MKSLLLTTVSVLLIGLTSCNFQPQDPLSKEVREVTGQIKLLHDELSMIHSSVIKNGMDRKKQKEIDKIVKKYHKLFSKRVSLAEKGGLPNAFDRIFEEHNRYYPYFFEYWEVE